MFKSGSKQKKEPFIVNRLPNSKAKLMLCLKLKLNSLNQDQIVGLWNWACIKRTIPISLRLCATHISSLGGSTPNLELTICTHRACIRPVLVLLTLWLSPSLSLCGHNFSPIKSTGNGLGLQLDSRAQNLNPKECATNYWQY